MEKKNKGVNNEDEGMTPMQKLLDTTFAKLKNLGSGDESSRLFPQGIESINLEIEQGTKEKPGFRLSLSINKNKFGSGETALANDNKATDGTAISFNSIGHHIIALIAQKDLQVRLPNVMEKVQQILDAGDRELEEAATFPDDIRQQQPSTRPFHFIDIPFRDGGPANPPLPAAPHVLTKIEEFSNFLSTGGGTAQDKVDALSWLIHLFGDVHQPLHCIDHISTLHPSGDRGGNGFKLKGSAKNLHSAWDGSINVLSSHLDEEGIADSILQEHPRQSLSNDLQINEPEKWARASFKLAKTFGYSITENPQDPPQLSQAYLTKMQEIGRRQAALAGYRLANRLETVLGQ